jgi:hypothetical protein
MRQRVIEPICINSPPDPHRALLNDVRQLKLVGKTAMELR